MVTSVQFLAVLLAGLAVAIADAFIKKVSATGDFWSALYNPWMLAILALYISQIILFIYVFTKDWQLGIVGNLQMVIYSISVVVIGFLFFGEKLSLTQIFGVVLGIAGVILMNL